MAPIPRLNFLQQFFRPVGQNVIANPNNRLTNNYVVIKGSLVSFNYTFWRNDSYPLVIVSDKNKDGKLWGVNLHYLTFPYIKQILGMSVNNPAFSYKSISGDAYMKKAFRCYKNTGVRQLKVLDHKFLLNIMSMVRSYDPAEVQIIRRQVQEQIRKQINPKANEITTLDEPDVQQNMGD